MLFWGFLYRPGRLWLKGLLYTATVFTILLGTLVIFTFDPNIR